MWSGPAYFCQTHYSFLCSYCSWLTFIPSLKIKFLVIKLNLNAHIWLKWLDLRLKRHKTNLIFRRVSSEKNKLLVLISPLPFNTPDEEIQIFSHKSHLKCSTRWGLTPFTSCLSPRPRARTEIASVSDHTAGHFSHIVSREAPTWVPICEASPGIVSHKWSSCKSVTSSLRYQQNVKTVYIFSPKTFCDSLVLNIPT